MTHNTTLTRDEQKAVVDRAVAGDTQAFAQLHDLYAGRVRKAVLRVVGPDDVEDATQTAWLQVYRKLGTWNGTAEFSTWVHTVAYNTAIDIHRDQKYDRQTMSLETTVQDGSGAEMVVFEPSVEERGYVFAGDRDKLYGAIGQLPPIQRMVILLRLQGASHEEIAEALQLTVSGVKTHVHRITARLRDGMGVKVKGKKKPTAK